eukprot:TRINITY_DN37134_c0_g1_i1.p1 TRINITY_DN37134_c0_g1~~TRINITY_DN37134_c0_g1_i1.p1  ORF type:complete len:118 (+),score=26.03 TRINITY_DN37134_c0_g1_i1:210-563(+)
MADLPAPMKLFIWSGPPMSMLGFLALNRTYYFPSFYPMLPSSQSVEVVPTSSSPSDAPSSTPRRTLFGVPVVAKLSSSSHPPTKEVDNSGNIQDESTSPSSVPIVTGYVHALSLIHI